MGLPGQVFNYAHNYGLHVNTVLHMCSVIRLFYTYVVYTVYTMLPNLLLLFILVIPGQIPLGNAITSLLELSSRTVPNGPACGLACLYLYRVYPSPYTLTCWAKSMLHLHSLAYIAARMHIYWVRHSEYTNIIYWLKRQTIIA